MLRRLIIILVTFCFVAASRATDSIDLGSGKQPQLALAPSGEILLTFGRDKSILFTRSTDGGKSFDAPTTVAEPKFTPLGMRRGPRITATKSAICIAAVTGEKGNGKDGDVFVWRSDDAGKHWRMSPRLNRIEGAAREGLIGIASDGEGRVFVAWLDLRSQKTQIFGALSIDGGLTFGDDTLVYHSIDGHVCECCHPSVAFDAEGNCLVMFRNWLGGNRDLYVARSRDDGRLFDSATKIGEGSWKLNGCPMDGGAIAIAADHSVQTAWQRNGEIFTSGTSGKESLIAKGRQPVIAVADKKPCVIWIDPKGKLMLQRDKSAPEELAANANFPSTISGPAGQLICAWESANHCLVKTVSPAP